MKELRGRASHHFLQLVNHLIPKPPPQYLSLLKSSKNFPLKSKRWTVNK